MGTAFSAMILTIPLLFYQNYKPRFFLKLFVVHNADKIELQVKASTRSQLPTINGTHFQLPDEEYKGDYFAVKDVFAELNASTIPGFIILFAIMCAFIEPSLTGAVIGFFIGLFIGIVIDLIDWIRTKRFNKS